MDARDLLRSQADEAHRDLLAALEGVDEPLAWAQVPLAEGRYLHTNGSILGIVQHLASSKIMYASAAFWGGRPSWRETAAEFDAIGASWPASKALLASAHARFMAAWQEVDLGEVRPTIRTEDWPVWRIVSLLSHHESYHAGQTELLKSTLAPTGSPPDYLESDDIREHCQGLRFW